MEITTLKNSTKMGLQIIKKGDFVLKYFKYCDIYFLFYKGRAIWDGDFNELEDDELRFYIFEIEPDRDKAAEFIIKLYNWISSQEEAFTKLLDEVYVEKI